MFPIKIILLNGPSGSGKTTQGQAVAKRFALTHPTICFGFADDLKRATHAAFGMFDVPFDQFEACKNTPMQEFMGITPRQAYIAHSEKYMKPLYGDNIFSVLACRRILHDQRRLQPGRNQRTVVVMTDCGFDIEARHLVRVFGVENVLVVRLHRKGRTFEGDSRGYLSAPVCEYEDMHNDCPFEQFTSMLYWRIMGFIEPSTQPLENEAAIAVEK